MAAQLPKVIARLRAEAIPHRLVFFDPAIRSATGVADAVGVEPACVLKTLVIEQVHPPGRPVIAMLPGTATVDLKALAERLGAKKLRMADRADAERVTGLRIGAISALVLRGRPFRFLIAAEAMQHDEVLVSAGEWGCDVALSPAHLARLTGARLMDLGSAGPCA